MGTTPLSPQTRAFRAPTRLRCSYGILRLARQATRETYLPLHQALREDQRGAVPLAGVRGEGGVGGGPGFIDAAHRGRLKGAGAVRVAVGIQGSLPFDGFGDK